MFPENGEVKKDLNQFIIEDLGKREAEACSTWDINATLKLPWGAKADVDPKFADQVIEYFDAIEGNVISIDSNRKVKMIRGGVKERKEKFTLIFRYQLISEDVAFQL